VAPSPAFRPPSTAVAFAAPPPLLFRPRIADDTDSGAPAPFSQFRGGRSGRRTRSAAVPPLRSRLRRRRLRRPSSSPEDYPLDAIDAASTFLSTPVPLPFLPPGPATASPAPSIPLAYILILAGAAAVFPPLTSAALAASFVSFVVLGRAVLADDDDGAADGGGEDDGDDSRSLSDLVALAGAVAATGLLSPEGFVVGGGVVSDSPSAGGFGISSGGGGALLLLGLAGLSVALGRLTGDESNGGDGEGERADRRLMDMWDERMENEGEDRMGR